MAGGGEISDLERSWIRGRRCAARRRKGGESSQRSRHERTKRADLLQCGRQKSGTVQNGLRGLSQPMHCASAIAGMAKGPFRLFHLGSHGVQVVGGRDYREQQNQCAAESADKDERSPCRTSCRTTRTGRRSPVPPQQTGGQQQGEPTEIKKKLHTKRRVHCRKRHNRNPVQLPQDNQDSTETASDLRTWRVAAGGPLLQVSKGVTTIPLLSFIRLRVVVNDAGIARAGCPTHRARCDEWESAADGGPAPTRSHEGAPSQLCFGCRS